jgi:peptidoglycan/LPS O-acetylase OafA/YrhL
VAYNSTLEGIQALRFLAALLVVLTHATFYTSERFPELSVWWQGGSGVNIFFVISGLVMVVSTTDLRRIANGWKIFTARRLIRIVPMYWVATSVKLAAVLFVPVLVFHSDFNLRHIISSYLFIPTVNAEGEFKPLHAVGWTLYFEMFFYALFALALGLRANPYWIGIVLVCFAALSPFRTPEVASTMFFDPVVLHFFAGMLVIAIIVGWPTLSGYMSRRPLAPALLSLIGFTLLLFWPRSMTNVPDALKTGVPATMVVLGVAWLEPLLNGRVPTWLLFLGDASYALYLFHPFVQAVIPTALQRIGVENVMVCVLLNVIAAIAIGAAVHVVLERPVTRLLKNGLMRQFQRAQAGAHK